MYTLNDGKLTLFKSEAGKKTSIGYPTERLVLAGSYWFSYLGIQSDEHYAARQAGAKVIKRVRILRNNQVTAGDVVEIGAERYRAGRVFHGLNKQNIPVTDITLELEKGGAKPSEQTEDRH